MKEQIQLPLRPTPGQTDDHMAPTGPGLVPINPDKELQMIESLTPEAEHIEWEQERDRMRITTTVPDNMQKLMDGKWNTHENERVAEPDVERAASCCAPIFLEKNTDDLDKAELKCLRRLKVPRTRLVPMIRELAKYYPKSSIQMSGMFLYPEEGGFMGWHTNSGDPCTRIYISHVKEGDKSFFRYRLNGEYVTSWDKAGWNMREFEVTRENPMWHCVYAEEQRMSIGFRINRNLL